MSVTSKVYMFDMQPPGPNKQSWEARKKEVDLKFPVRVVDAKAFGKP